MFLGGGREFARTSSYRTREPPAQAVCRFSREGLLKVVPTRQNVQPVRPRFPGAWRVVLGADDAGAKPTTNILPGPCAKRSSPSTVNRRAEEQGTEEGRSSEREVGHSNRARTGFTSYLDIPCWIFCSSVVCGPCGPDVRAWRVFRGGREFATQLDFRPGNHRHRGRWGPDGTSRTDVSQFSTGGA